MARVKSSQSKVESPELGPGIYACSRRGILLPKFREPQFTMRKALGSTIRFTIHVTARQVERLRVLRIFDTWSET